MVHSVNKTLLSNFWSSSTTFIQLWDQLWTNSSHFRTTLSAKTCWVTLHNTERYLLEAKYSRKEEEEVGQHHKLFPTAAETFVSLVSSVYVKVVVSEYISWYYSIVHLLNNFMLVEFSHLEDKSFLASAKMDVELPFYPNRSSQSDKKSKCKLCGTKRGEGNNAWKMRMLIHQRHLGGEKIDLIC